MNAYLDTIEASMPDVMKDVFTFPKEERLDE
jgi:hypothetical protein